MRPIATVLNFAFDHLYYDRFGCREKAKYICRALQEACDAGELNIAECEAACEVVADAVYKMNRGFYLISAAKESGEIAQYVTLRCEEYIGFRDKWLRALIAQQEVPK